MRWVTEQSNFASFSTFANDYIQRKRRNITSIQRTTGKISENNVFPRISRYHCRSQGRHGKFHFIKHLKLTNKKLNSIFWQLNRIFLEFVKTPGRLKLTDQHLIFKNQKTGKVEQISSSDMEMVNFQKFVGTWGLRIFLKNGTLHRFRGFKEAVSWFSYFQYIWNKFFFYHWKNFFLASNIFCNFQQKRKNLLLNFFSP